LCLWNPIPCESYSEKNVGYWQRGIVPSAAKPDKFEGIFHEANPERTLKGTVPDSGFNDFNC